MSFNNIYSNRVLSKDPATNMLRSSLISIRRRRKVLNIELTQINEQLATLIKNIDALSVDEESIMEMLQIVDDAKSNN